MPDQSSPPIDDRPSARPIVIAINESGGAAALAMGRAQAARNHGELVVASVVQTPPILAVPARRELLFPGAAERQVEHRRTRVLTRLLEGDELTQASLRSIEVSYGDAAEEIAGIARETDARLIVMGIGPRPHPSTFASGGTAYETAKLGVCPVLAVDDAHRQLPRQVVVGMDFTAESANALATCLPLIADGATVHLVHVWWNMEGTAPADELQARNAKYLSSLPAEFRRVRASLPPHGLVRFDPVVREGNVADTLLAVAREVGAELVVVASHGYGAMKRMILGSTSSALLRQAECSVLVVPPAPEEPA